MSHWQHRRTPAHTTFRTTRDLLLTHRTDHDTAYASFRRPRPTHFHHTPHPTTPAGGTP
ncbi:hypothetical protein [Kitasatospora sp. NPDC004531]